MKFKKFSLLIYLFVGVLCAQEYPPILNYDSKNYNAGNQNWMIAQGDDNILYIANNSGLLSFNGEQWELNKVTDGSAVRSVLVHEEKIYTGSYMDFGYWEKQQDGKLAYTSLKSVANDQFLDGEQFWHIANLGDYIVFQSLRRLYSYNTKDKKISIVSPEHTIINLFEVNQKLYYQVAEEGLYAIGDASVDLIVPSSEIENKILVGLFSYKNSLLAVSRYSGLFLLKNGRSSKYNVSQDSYPITNDVYTSILTQDNTLVLGTIGHGIYLLDLQANTKTHLLQPTILNNTVLALLEDHSGNIWSGLDNGISVINKQSPVQLYTDIFGDIGTVYCSFKRGDFIYLGTNQGLYYRDVQTENNYQLVKGTSGQVWDIQEIDGQLYVGHNRGTFIISENVAKQIFSDSGTWQLIKIGDDIVQGHYNGLSHFKPEQPDSIAYIANFNLSSRNLVVEDSTTLWVGHDHKGIFKLELNSNCDSVLGINNYAPKTQDGLGLWVFKLADSIYYSTSTKIFKYLKTEDLFSDKNELQDITGEQKRTSGITKVLNDETWWSFGEDEIFYVSRDAFQDKFVTRSIPIPKEFRSIANGFENVSLIEDHTYLIGSNIGYSQFTLPFNTLPSGELKLRSIETATVEGKYNHEVLNIENLDLPNAVNTLRFQFSLPNYDKLNKAKYSYRLSGFSNSWSNWDHNDNAVFKNLPAGDYTFEVKSKSGGSSSNSVKYAFSIAPPWYLTTTAIATYIILFIVVILVVHRLYTGYYRKQRAKLIERNKEQLELSQLEAQQEIMQLKNAQLEVDVASKNRELAASTMNLIKKNEFLTVLKSRLESSKDQNDILDVVKIINKDIAEKDNWKLFKEAFDNADKNFLQAIKETHPSLTSNDLKLCAYLRLNLSSKEIAPLLNISVRSVEIKRYRLRKKMKLEHEEGLVEYILSFKSHNIS
tara:strand:+ start:161717 stop:164518 length:2802 start_codon:yes stop_codon:yes gene_type:complete